MQLVDAIEAWGRAHRDEFDDDETQAVADVWRKVRASEHATIDVTTMAKDEARAVMSAFPNESRKSAAAMLNKVRKWTIAQQSEPVATATTDNVVTIGATSPSPSAQETVRDSGPVEGWQPPASVDERSMAIDQRIVLGLLGAVLAVLLVWFLFLRGDDAADPAPADSAPATVEDITSISNQAFLGQYELSPEVEQCLIDEFGDLAAAVTDATLRARQVCGTSLLAIITDGG